MDGVLNRGTGGWFVIAAGITTYGLLTLAGAARAKSSRTAAARRPEGSLRLRDEKSSQSRAPHARGYTDGNDKHSSDYSCRQQLVLQGHWARHPRLALRTARLHHRGGCRYSGDGSRTGPTLARRRRSSAADLRPALRCDDADDAHGHEGQSWRADERPDGFRAERNAKQQRHAELSPIERTMPIKRRHYP